MKRTDARSSKSLFSFSAIALLALGAATAQVATATGIDASGSYQQEVNACMTGKTQQDQADCLKEARNAQADKRRGVLEPTSGDLAANALARCDVMTGAEDKAACKARIMGYGSTEGSVAGGGLIREVETVVAPAGVSEFQITPKTDSEPVVLTPSGTLR
ncbi:hypothetical protein [Ramlibacter sp.]|uniref:hypothetical protein n=1 Tax=Ramlibacter sp. TaxID=1917967 RepID=UPI003D0A7C70